MDRKRVLFILVLAFAAVYYLGRLVVYFAVQGGSGGFEVEVTELEESVVKASFLAIGILGLALLPGLYLKKAWGFWGTAALSIYTIVFDVWAVLAIQSSAAAGIIPAAIILVYLLFSRDELLPKA